MVGRMVERTDRQTDVFKYAKSQTQIKKDRDRLCGYLCLSVSDFSQREKMKKKRRQRTVYAVEETDEIFLSTHPVDCANDAWRGNPGEIS